MNGARYFAEYLKGAGVTSAAEVLRVTTVR